MVDANKFGILSALAITVIAVGFVFSSHTTTPNSIQLQGQKVIEKTTEEILEAPTKAESLAEKSIDLTKEIPEKIPDSFSEAVNKLKEIPPELPPIVEKSMNEEKLSVQISIQPGASNPDCDAIVNCLSSHFPTIIEDGKVTWTNNDDASHTIVSGNPRDGPNGIFNSGLIPSTSTYSQVFEIQGKYEYFCQIHPWIQGTIIVEEV